MKKSNQEIKNRILTFTKKRGSDKSVCPSEVTKDLFADVWRDHVDDVRNVARELQNQRLIKVTQRGKEIPLDKAKGPIRLSIVNGNKS